MKTQPDIELLMEVTAFISQFRDSRVFKEIIPSGILDLARLAMSGMEPDVDVDYWVMGDEEAMKRPKGFFRNIQDSMGHSRGHQILADLGFIPKGDVIVGLKDGREVLRGLVDSEQQVDWSHGLRIQRERAVNRLFPWVTLNNWEIFPQTFTETERWFYTPEGCSAPHGEMVDFKRDSAEINYACIDGKTVVKIEDIAEDLNAKRFQAADELLAGHDDLDRAVDNGHWFDWTPRPKTEVGEDDEREWVMAVFGKEKDGDNRHHLTVIFEPDSAEINHVRLDGGIISLTVDDSPEY